MTICPIGGTLTGIAGSTSGDEKQTENAHESLKKSEIGRDADLFFGCGQMCPG